MASSSRPAAAARARRDLLLERRGTAAPRRGAAARSATGRRRAPPRTRRAPRLPVRARAAPARARRARARIAVAARARDRNAPARPSRPCARARGSRATSPPDRSAGSCFERRGELALGGLEIAGLQEAPSRDSMVASPLRWPRTPAARSARRSPGYFGAVTTGAGSVLAAHTARTQHQRGEHGACASPRSLHTVHAYLHVESAQRAGAARRRRSTPVRRALRASSTRACRYRRAIRSRSRGIVRIERQRDAADVERQPRGDRLERARRSPSPSERRDAQRRRIQLLQAAALVGRDELIAFVVDLDEPARRSRRPPRAPAHGGHAPIAIRRRRIDDVQDQIGLGDLFERRAKRRDQRVRQAVDEPDRVRHEQLAAVRQPDLPDQRIERHEQRVRRFGPGRASAR